MKGLVQVEWDFREIGEEMLLPALVYEYARSSPKILAEIARWKREGMPAVFDTDDLRAHPEYPNYSVPLEVGGIVMFTKGSLRTPWTKLNPKTRVQILDSRDWEQKERAAWFHSGAFIWAPSPPDGVFTVDWNKSPEAILNSIKDLLKVLRPGRTKIARANHPGRAAQKPFHYLKWLSAHRLSTAGIPFGKAQDLLKPLKPSADESNRYLPIYTKNETWQGAVALAGAAIEATEAGHFEFL